MTRLSLGFSALALLGLSVSACDVVDDLGSSEDAVEVTPVDTENWARLTLSLPTGSCLPGQSCSRPLGASPSITIDGAAVNLGAVTRLKPGEHSIGTNGGFAKITLAPGEVRSYALPVARSKCTAAPLPGVPVTDFGKSIALTTAQCPTAVKGTSPSSVSFSLSSVEPFYSANCGLPLSVFGGGAACPLYAPYTVYSVRVSGGSCINIPAINGKTACDAATAGNWTWAANAQPGGSLAATDRVFVPDTYSVSVGSTTQSFTLAEGSISEVAISLPVVGAVPSVFKTNVAFADIRALPSAGSAPSISSNCGDRAYVFGANAVGTVNLNAFTDSSCVYTLNAAGRSTTLSQSAVNAITINRIDVGDVVVTREDGTTYKARGTYELFFGGNRVVANLPTNSGIDVLPGRYELVISYSTVDGPKTQRHTLSL